MSDLTPSSGGRLTRRTREQRAFRLVVAGGIASTVALVTFVLALINVIGWGLFIISIIVAVACILMFRRTVSR
jgi:hypothetical protein